jgi:multiple sugar transport system ATP-binding protein
VHNAAFDLDVPAEELPADLDGQAVQLGARPQDLRPVGSAGDADVTVTGTVDLIEPLGTDAIVRVQTDEGPVTAMVDGYERLDHGDELSLGIDLDEIYLFDAAGELLKPRHYDAATADEVTA